MLTTGEAADAVGIRYETLRNWLKKGLLAGGVPSVAGKAHKWRSYSETDVFKLRLTKDALSAGVPLNAIIDICNDPELSGLLQEHEATSPGVSVHQGVYVLIWNTMPEAQYMIVDDGAIVTELKRNRAPATLLNLSHATVRNG